MTGESQYARISLFGIQDALIRACSARTALKRLPQHGDVPALWTRVTALLCMLMTLGLVVPQACHTHLRLGLSLRHGLLQVSDSGDDAVPEGSCSICVALQAGAPVGAMHLVHGLTRTNQVVEAPPQVFADRPRAFSLNSRPPPATHSA